MVEGRKRNRVAEMGGVSESAALSDSTLSASTSDVLSAERAQ